MRALEKRLGSQLVDRSGRRVEPTEAGRRLYRGAQRLLALEEQLLGEIEAESEGARAASWRSAPRPGPAAIVVPLLLCEFQRDTPALRVSLAVLDTQTVVEQVADASSSSGSSVQRGATARSRFEPFMRDEVILACPPGHRFAGRDSRARRAA